MSLAIILNAREKDSTHRALLIFSAAMFFYMLTDFITYYFLSSTVSDSLVFIFITMSDTLYCVMIASWIYTVTVMADVREAMGTKCIVTVSAAYLVSSQILSIYLGRYDTYTLHVADSVLKNVLQLLNLGYVIFIVTASIRIIWTIRRKQIRKRGRSMNLAMAWLLTGYMVYIVYWDYSTWYDSSSNLLNVYAIDPLILIYAAFNVYLIIYFCRRDPLAISFRQISPDQAVDLVVSEYDLSAREKQVISLVNKGFSNKQIAADLSISENTVKRHLTNIFAKTGTQSRHEIIYLIARTR